MEFEDFYQENKDLFYRWAYSYTRERENARDIVQEASMIVAKHWSRVRKMKNAIGYSLRIITNLAKKQQKRPKPLLLSDNEWDALSTETDIENRLDQQKKESWLYEALNTLRPIEKEVILLRDVENMDFNTLAMHIGIPLSTAKSHYRRAKLKLIKLWEESYEKTNM